MSHQQQLQQQQSTTLSPDIINSKPCRIHKCLIKYVCTDLDCHYNNKNCCAECIMEGEHRDHSYCPIREVMQTLQDGAIHALRYYDGCQKNLDIREQIEQIIEDMKESVCQAIDKQKETILKYIGRKQLGSDFKWVDHDPQQARLRRFLNLTEWPTEKLDQQVASVILNEGPQYIIDEEVRYVMHHNSEIVQRTEKKMNDVLYHVAQFFEESFQNFVQDDIKYKNGTQEQQSRLNQSPVKHTSPTYTQLKSPHSLGGNEAKIQKYTKQRSPQQQRQQPQQQQEDEEEEEEGSIQNNFDYSLPKRDINPLDDSPQYVFDIDLFKGSVYRVFSGHSDFVRKILKVNKEMFLSISDDSTIKLWNFNSSKSVADFKGLHTNQILDVKHLKDNMFVSCGRDNRIVWFDVVNFQKKICEITQSVFSLDIIFGRYVVLGGNKHIFYVDSEHNEVDNANILPLKPLQLNAHLKEILVLTRISDSGVFATGSFDKTIKIWNFHLGKQGILFQEELIGHKQAVRSLCVGKKQSQIFSGSDDFTIIMWDWQTGQQLQVFEGHTGSVYAIEALSPTQIVSGSYDKTIKIWNSQDRQCIGTVRGNKTGIMSLTKFNSQILLSGSDDHTIKAWI